MSDPLLFTLVQDLEFQTGYRIKQVVATRAEIVDAIHASYPDKALARLNQPGGGLAVQGPRASAGSRGVDDARAACWRRSRARRGLVRARPKTTCSSRPARGKGATPETAPIIDLVDLVIKSALKSRASDIHIEPTENNVVVRHRLDGLLKEVMDLPKWVHEGLVARMKIMGGHGHRREAPAAGRPHPRRRPTTGRRSTSARRRCGRSSARRSCCACSTIARACRRSRSSASPRHALEHIRFFLRHQHGMILVVGPTGSGKTTTLCSALTSVRSERTNIITIEDPVEYQIPGVNQTQINAKINLTFASALRSILRQDPDVVLVGEIRDQETARIAMQAAQTGHLVLSTLHTDDAPSCVTRLTDIGIEPYVSASALIGVIAQRLMRRLCMHCKRPYTPDAETLRAMSVTEAEAATLTFYRAVGCEQCNHTGYRGRVGIYEIMHVTDKLRRHDRPEGLGSAAARRRDRSGMISLGEDGLLKVKAGVTTPEELLRVVTEVREARAVCPGVRRRASRPISSRARAAVITSAAAARTATTGAEPGWKFCPYCAKSTDTASPGKRAKKLREQRADARAAGRQQRRRVQEVMLRSWP